MNDIAEKLARLRRIRSTDLPKSSVLAFLLKFFKTFEVLLFKLLELLKWYRPQKSIVGVPSLATRQFASLQAVVYNGSVEEVLGFRPRRWLYRLLFKGVPDLEMFERVRFQLSYSDKIKRTVQASTETRGFVHLQLPWQLPWHTQSRGSAELKSAGVETLTGTVPLGLYEVHNPSIFFLNESVKWVVVSDIDDTIKDSNIAESTSIKGILKSVFRGHYYTYEAIAGMAELYQDLAARGALIVYLTSTPYQLTPFLLKFLSDCKFPEGPLFPRWLGYGKTRHKWRTMHKIFSSTEDQKCYLVGDSGELDLEIYRRVCENKAFRNKIDKILIRQVPGTQELKPQHDREVMYQSMEELRNHFRDVLS